MKEILPWWARIAGKLILSRLPTGYDRWRKLGLFTHGAMDQSDYALRVFQQHFRHSLLGSAPGFVVLELGPGDSLSSALIAAAYGAKHTHLVDVGRFATSNLNVYRNIARELLACHMQPPNLDNVHSIDELLHACGASYHTQGLTSLREIPAKTVDFIWSHAVLEHLRRRQFEDLMRETRRLLRDTGVCSHQVDLRDHLGGALNNMRIPSRWWEAEWMARSGFYTNRLRRSEMIRAFHSAGFAVDVVATQRWETLPIPRRALASEFQNIDREELLEKEFQVVLRPM